MMSYANSLHNRRPASGYTLMNPIICCVQQEKMQRIPHLLRSQVSTLNDVVCDHSGFSSGRRCCIFAGSLHAVQQTCNDNESCCNTFWLAHVRRAVYLGFIDFCFSQNSSCRRNLGQISNANLILLCTTSLHHYDAFVDWKRLWIAIWNDIKAIDTIC